MVNFNTPGLNDTFRALADPTRRGILATLASGGEVTLSELARPLPMSLPAVMKHVAVLDDAGLVSRRKIGRSVYCRLEPGPLKDATAWLSWYESFWSAGLDRLGNYLEENPCPPTSPTKSRTSASSSNANSAPRRKASGRRGRKAKP